MQKNDLSLVGAIILILGVIEVLALIAAGATSTEVAAWVEAIGVLMAMVVAIVVPMQVEKARQAKEDEEKGQKTYSLAVSLIGAIFLLENEVKRVAQRLNAAKDAIPPEVDWEGWLENSCLFIPTALVKAVPLMHGLQENIVSDFRNAAMLSDTFNGYVSQYGRLQYASVAGKWTAAHAQLQNQIQLLLMTIEKVQAQLPKET